MMKGVSYGKLAAGVGTAAAIWYILKLKRNADRSAAAVKGKAEVESQRAARLNRAQTLFGSKQYNLAELSEQLSKEAEFATVVDCKVLPPVNHNERFYDVSVLGGKNEVDAKYGHWIDRVWNKDVIAFPQIIVRPSTPEDVAVALAFADRNDLKISVAAGCHSANAFVDGALTIDLAKLTGIQYDSNSHELVVGSGATLSEVDDACIAHGRALPVGTNGDTGVSGLTLSGGTGWLGRKFGLTCDNLVGIDVVLPSGEYYQNIRDSSPKDQRDILWACRGSGGHFGVVTKFYFSTNPMPNEDKLLFGTIVSFCPTSAMKRNTIKGWWQKIKNCTNDTQCVLVLPSGANVVPTVWLHVGPEAPKGEAATKTVDDLKKAVQPVKGGGLFNLVNAWKVVNYKFVQARVKDSQLHGYLYQTMIAVIDLSDDVIKCMVDNIHRAPAKAVMLVMPLGGAISELDTSSCERCSFSTRHAKAWVLLEVRWHPEIDGNEAGKAKARNWCRQFVAEVNAQCPSAMAKTSHAFSDARDENAGEGYNALVDVTRTEVAQRLKDIKSRVDPHNLLNHNRKLSAN